MQAGQGIGSFSDVFAYALVVSDLCEARILLLILTFLVYLYFDGPGAIGRAR